jgi:hypothetical protein
MRPDCGRTLRHPTASCSHYGRRPWTTNGPPSVMEEGGKREPISMSSAPPALGDGGLSCPRPASAISTAFLATGRLAERAGVGEAQLLVHCHRKYVDCRAARLSYRRPLPSVWRTNRPDSHRAVSIAIGAATLCRSPGYRVRGTTRAELLMVNDPGRVETGQGTVPSDTWCSGATNRWQCDRKVLFGRRQMAYRSKS